MTETARADAGKMQNLLTTFDRVGLPLLTAINDVQSKAESADPRPLQADTFGALMDSTVTLMQKMCDQLGAGQESLNPGIRWALAGAAAQTVGAAFKHTARPMTADEAAHIASIAINLQGTFKAQIPAGQETIPNTIATFRAKMLEAMVPVVDALAQYSFGRAEHALLAEVAERLVKTADQVTRALAPTGASPEEWRLLCWHVLKAAGQIYTDAHFAESDRLVYMDPEERAAYFAQHGQIVPMTQVWQSFNQRMAILATLATYLDVPESAKLDAGGW